QSTGKALGVEIRGPAGLIVLTVGAACLVLANVHSFNQLTTSKQKAAPQPPPVATSASTEAQPSTNASSPVFPTELAGTWTGVYEQSTGQSYRMELVITGNLGTAQVRYPELGCFGTV